MLFPFPGTRPLCVIKGYVFVAFQGLLGFLCVGLSIGLLGDGAGWCEIADDKIIQSPISHVVIICDWNIHLVVCRFISPHISTK